MFKRWFIAAFAICIFLFHSGEQVTAYVNHQVELDQQTREALEEKYGLDKPSDPYPTNDLWSGDWGASFNPPLNRHQIIIQIVRWVQQPLN
ncbi:hypothetical protein [Paenibacillus xylanilyticus]|uniref:hypothetical protein n=1 Tax=Paenibacillus xylanilyticus TaxID=248903 RepID=UPI0039A399B3